MAKTIQVRKSTTRDVTVDVTGDLKGNAIITANGVPVLKITTRGYLSRVRDLPEAAGVRRLPDGRIAIRPKRQR